MAWGDIRPDRWQRIPVALNPGYYLLKEHKYAVPAKRTGAVQGVTITEFPVMMKGDDARIYIQQSIADGLTGLIPHYYVAFSGVWQVLDTADCWQRKDGKPNDRTVCIALIASEAIGIPPMYSISAFNAAARLTAYILHKNKLYSDNIILSGSPYVKRHWKEFKIALKKQQKKL